MVMIECGGKMGDFFEVLEKWGYVGYVGYVLGYVFFLIYFWRCDYVCIILWY